jgi:hypothetical protein
VEKKDALAAPIWVDDAFDDAGESVALRWLSSNFGRRIQVHVVESDCMKGVLRQQWRVEVIVIILQ